MLPKILMSLKVLVKGTSERSVSVLLLLTGSLLFSIAASPPTDFSDHIYFQYEEPEIQELEYQPIEYIPIRLEDLYYHPLTAQEYRLLLVQIAIETEGCSIEAKRLVAQCILDRTETKTHSSGTVYSTLTWRGQFDYRRNYRIHTADHEAIDWVFTQGNRVTDGRIIYFCSPRYLKPRIRNWFYSFNKLAEKDGLVFFSNTKR